MITFTEKERKWILSDPGEISLGMDGRLQPSITSSMFIESPSSLDLMLGMQKKPSWDCGYTNTTKIFETEYSMKNLLNSKPPPQNKRKRKASWGGGFEDKLRLSKSDSVENGFVNGEQMGCSSISEKVCNLQIQYVAQRKVELDGLRMESSIIKEFKPETNKLLLSKNPIEKKFMENETRQSRMRHKAKAPKAVTSLVNSRLKKRPKKLEFAENCHCQVYADSTQQFKVTQNIVEVVMPSDARVQEEKFTRNSSVDFLSTTSIENQASQGDLLLAPPNPKDPTSSRRDSLPNLVKRNLPVKTLRVKWKGGEDSLLAGSLEKPKRRIKMAKQHGRENRCLLRIEQTNTATSSTKKEPAVTRSTKKELVSQTVTPVENPRSQNCYGEKLANGNGSTSSTWEKSRGHPKSKKSKKAKVSLFMSASPDEAENGSASSSWEKARTYPKSETSDGEKKPLILSASTGEAQNGRAPLFGEKGRGYPRPDKSDGEKKPLTLSASTGEAQNGTNPLFWEKANGHPKSEKCDRSRNRLILSASTGEAQNGKNGKTPLFWEKARGYPKSKKCEEGKTPLVASTFEAPNDTTPLFWKKAPKSEKCDEGQNPLIVSGTTSEAQNGTTPLFWEKARGSPKSEKPDTSKNPPSPSASTGEARNGTTPLFWETARKYPKSEKCERNKIPLILSASRCEAPNGTPPLFWEKAPKSEKCDGGKNPPILTASTGEAQNGTTPLFWEKAKKYPKSEKCEVGKSPLILSPSTCEAPNGTPPLFWKKAPKSEECDGGKNPLILTASTGEAQNGTTPLFWEKARGRPKSEKSDTSKNPESLSASIGEAENDTTPLFWEKAKGCPKSEKSGRSKNPVILSASTGEAQNDTTPLFWEKARGCPKAEKSGRSKNPVILSASTGEAQNDTTPLFWEKAKGCPKLEKSGRSKNPVILSASTGEAQNDTTPLCWEKARKCPKSEKSGRSKNPVILSASTGEAQNDTTPLFWEKARGCPKLGKSDRSKNPPILNASTGEAQNDSTPLFWEKARGCPNSDKSDRSKNPPILSAFTGEAQNGKAPLFWEKALAYPKSKDFEKAKIPLVPSASDEAENCYQRKGPEDGETPCEKGFQADPLSSLENVTSDEDSTKSNMNNTEDAPPMEEYDLSQGGNARVRTKRLLQLFHKIHKQFKGGHKEVDVRNIIVECYPEYLVNGSESMYGDVPGVEAGDRFNYRVEMDLVGLHHQLRRGIDVIAASKSSWCIQGKPVSVAACIVVAGGYVDNRDEGDIIIYTGEGGNNHFYDKGPSKDQMLTFGNKALRHSMMLGLYVRVIRKFDIKPPTKPYYRYDGLYEVMEMKKERSRGHRQKAYKDDGPKHKINKYNTSSFKPLVYKFMLVRKSTREKYKDMNLWAYKPPSAQATAPQ